MSYPKMAKMITFLEEKTLSGKLQWEVTAEEGVFQIPFSEYTVQISCRKGDNYPYFQLEIFNDEGILVEQVDDEDLKDDFKGRTSWGIMKTLYDEARRSAMGAQKALDSILSELDDSIPF